MNTFISMLRGINVSGQKKITMAELRSLYESLDLVNVKTYIQSGNVIFNCTKQDASKLSDSIEAQIEQTFGYSVTQMILSKSFTAIYSRMKEMKTLPNSTSLFCIIAHPRLYWAI